MSETGGLRLSLPARAENVAVARHAVAGLAEAIGMSEPKVADLKTVVTEACMNVVLHAYDDDGGGALEVNATPEDGALLIRVRDYGTGIRPRADVERASLRLGLPLIAALSSSFNIRGGLGQGTEVTMRLALAANGADPVDAAASGASAAKQGPDLTVGAELTVVDDLVGPVVSRVVSMLAARSDFSVDRLSDAVLLGDAISAFAPQGFDGGPVHLVIEDGDGSVNLRVGPMASGSGERLRRELEVPGLGASIERLADEVGVSSDDQGEYLTLKVSQGT
jgi:anti-sigma regulatory factor (Ser/Thr protein kinase)